MDDYQMQELKALMKGQETYLVRSWKDVPVVSSASGREQVLLARVVTECFKEIEA